MASQQSPPAPTTAARHPRPTKPPPRTRASQQSPPAPTTSRPELDHRRLRSTAAMGGSPASTHTGAGKVIPPPPGQAPAAPAGGGDRGEGRGGVELGAGVRGAPPPRGETTRRPRPTKRPPPHPRPQQTPPPPPAPTTAARCPRPQQSPPPPPPPGPTTILDLGEDLLREIFHHLPSLPSLIRAALSCHTFLDAVRSSPAFRRHFRAARPPPLLGFFDPKCPAIASFAPIRRNSDSDLAAAVRGADFFLTRLPLEDDAYPGWFVCDCSGGYVLLSNEYTGQLAAYNPLTRALDLIPLMPDEVFDDCHGRRSLLHLLSSKEGGRTFRVVTTCLDDLRARAAVFSSASREWQIFPWSEPVTPHPEDKDWLKIGKMVNGFVYWIVTNDAYMIVLNTETLEVSQMDLPPSFEGQNYRFSVGEAKDGKLCLVCPINFDLYIWFWRADDDGIEIWMLDKWFQFEDYLETNRCPVEHGGLHIVDTVDGFVYFSTCGTSFSAAHSPHSPPWFLCLCIETGQVDQLFQKQCDGNVWPYIMPWPPSLEDNKVCPQLEGA